MIRNHVRSAARHAATALAGTLLASLPAAAGVVFSESFESPVVSGFAGNTVPSGGKWIGATDGFGATNRGLYNEAAAWPATPAFATPYGAQAYYINYTNSALTTAVGATGQTLTAGVAYQLTFNAAVTTGTASANYRVELVAFAAAEDNTARTDANGTMPGTVLASATGAVTTTNMSAAASITFTPDGANAHLGKDLGIRLVKSSGSVLYDNVRLITGHDMNPAPASGVTIAGGDVPLSWTNMPATTGTDVYVDVWFGTNPAALAKTVDGGLNTSSTIVTAPGANTYYWRIDSFLNGSHTGTPVAGDLFVFYVTDTDLDGFPDTYELANTNPPSNTALNPGDDLDSDGLTNLQEYQYGTGPNDPDSDNDTLLDGPEINGTAGARPATNPLLADSDADGLSDGVETNTGTWVSAADTGTNPKDADWDNDGIKDGVETKTGTFVGRATDTGTDPYLADTDADGTLDWYEVSATFTDPNSAAEKSPIPYPLPDPVSTDLGAPDKPVKVYIMAGQSNMVGIGYVNDLGEPGSLSTIAKLENKFANLVDDSNAWTKRNDVIYKGVVTATAAGPLTAGQGSDSSTIGPELGFGHVMGWYHDEPVLIIKASQGNRSLGWDFLPPGSSQWISGANTYAGYGQSPPSWLTAGGGPAPGGWYAGKQYDDCFLAESNMGMIPWAAGTAYASGVMVRHDGAVYVAKSAHTADASSEPEVGASWSTYWSNYTITNAADILNFNTGLLQNLSTTGNDLNGRSFEIAGFVWWQGHKDQDGGSIYSTRYETNLVQLIKELRSDFNAPNAPFVVATIGFGGELAPKSAAFDLVHNAQMAVSDYTKYPEFAGTVKSVDTLPYWRELDESPGGQGYHYNNNAETYMLVGDAVGRTMLTMQDDVSPPSPDPMTFAIAPTAVNTTTVGMVATTAVDVSNPVEYYFENTSNGNNSDWITSTAWNNTGLSNGVSYDFRVKARDAGGAETTWSASASAAPGNDVTAPSPDPMSFASPLSVLGENSIAMTATPATDINGVEYAFVCTAGGGPNSGWQASPDYTAAGLNPGTAYTYTVQARDTIGNATAASAPASATTTAPDTTPPTPDPMSFASPPTALGTDTINMTAATATDPSGVEYYFEETSNNPGGDDSGWQDSTSYADSGLQPGTQYSYRVYARDKSPAHAATNWSPIASATTGLPDTTPPAVTGINPAPGASNVAVDASLVVTFNEEIALGIGLITIKNLTDATQSMIDVTNGSQVSAAGTVLTVNPTANLGYSKTYAIQIAATAIKDVENNSFGGILDDTTWTFTTVAEPSGPGGAVIYEPFEDGNSTLNGNTPGTGLSGAWASNGASVTAGSLTYGNLPAGSGNKASFNNHNGYASVGSTLSAAGLLDDGASLWFSVLVRTGGDIATNGDLGFALGTDQIGSGNNIPVANSGRALGFTFKNNQLRASYWAPALTRSTTNTGNGAAANTLYLVVGKFTWGVATDKIEIYSVAPDLTLGSAVSSYTTPSNVDQALFDTISCGSKSATPAHLFDEIRLGSSYESVIGLGGTGDTFADWIADYPGVGGLSGFDDDPDLDGNGNGLENYFGTDPSGFSAGLVAGTKIGNTFTFSHPLNATPASDITAAYRWSKDLATFHADGATGGGTTVTFAPGVPAGGMVTVTATITGTPADKLFVDLKVTQE